MFRILTVLGGLFIMLAPSGVPAQGLVERAMVVKVGDTVVLRGLRAACNSDTASAIESTQTYETGRVITASRRCGGRTAMPQTIFIAERPGAEVITLRQDVVTVTVTE